MFSLKIDYFGVRRIYEDGKLFAVLKDTKLYISHILNIEEENYLIDKHCEVCYNKRIKMHEDALQYLE